MPARPVPRDDLPACASSPGEEGAEAAPLHMAIATYNIGCSSALMFSSAKNMPLFLAKTCADMDRLKKVESLAWLGRSRQDFRSHEI